MVKEEGKGKMATTGGYKHPEIDDTLKPCPFCGGDAVMLIDEEAEECTPYGIARYVAYGVECISCEAKGELCHTEEDAAEAWNRRAEGGREC